ncbi:MAG: type II secretion system F family protein [Phycisphaerales bacterium]
MAVFRYRALELGTGARRRGEIAADSPAAARATLRSTGLLAESIAAVGGAGQHPIRLPAGIRDALGGVLRRWQRGRNTAASVEWYEGLSMLLLTGTPLVAALDTLASTFDRRAAGSLSRVLADAVRRGQSLAGAAHDHPQWFSEADRALLDAAEANGSLGQTCAELAAERARGDELKTQLSAALAYPVLLLVLGVGVAVFLATVTLPQLVGVLRDAGVPVPAATDALLASGALIREHWMMAVIGIVMALSGIAWLLWTPRLARLRLLMPLAGPVLRRSQTARLARLLSRLLRGGIPLDEALRLAIPTVGNAAMRTALTELRSDLRSGADIAPALERSAVFEPVFVRVIAVGEQSGELPAVLETLSERQHASAERMITRLAAALEPAAILAMAALIGIVVYAAIAPMLRLAQTF